MAPESANSFNAVYTSYYRKSFLFVKSYVHDELIAEDIVSESLIKLWQRMKSQPIEHVGSFLFTIYKNGALDYLKHESIERKAYHLLHELLKRKLEIRISILESCDPKEIFSTEIQRIIKSILDTLPDSLYTKRMGSAFLIDKNTILQCSTNKNYLVATDLEGKILWKVKTGGLTYRAQFIPNRSDK